MKTKGEIITIMNHAIILIEQLGGENEIADELQEVINQLEEEWEDEFPVDCYDEVDIDKITVVIYDIKWDMDEDDNTELPTEIEYIFYGYDDINDEVLIEEISDWLSCEYGYCHKGFRIREAK